MIVRMPVLRGASGVVLDELAALVAEVTPDRIQVIGEMWGASERMDPHEQTSSNSGM